MADVYITLLEPNKTLILVDDDVPPAWRVRWKAGAARPHHLHGGGQGLARAKAGFAVVDLRLEDGSGLMSWRLCRKRAKPASWC